MFKNIRKKQVITTTCSKCMQNPLMKGVKCRVPTNCFIVHKELAKKGLIK